MPKVRVKCANPNCKGKGYVDVYPYRLKTTKEFYCCKECQKTFYFKPRKKQLSVTCDLEGCNNVMQMTETEFDKSKYHFCCNEHKNKFREKRVKVKCALASCGKEFELPEYRLKQTPTHYCCKEHQNLAQQNRKEVICGYCGKEFELNLSDYTRSKTHYCCPEHYILASKTNRYEFFEDYAALIINSKKHGEIRVKIDKEDVEKCKELTWIANYNQKLCVWYIQNITYTNNVGKTTYLHRYIMDCPNDKEVDHIFHDAFDCRKQSLKIVTREENLENKLPTKRSTTGYLNVYKSQTEGKYTVSVRKKGKAYYGGTFDNIEEANLKAIEIRNSIMTNNILDRMTSNLLDK